MIGQPVLAQAGASGTGDLVRTLAIPSDPSNDQELERAQISQAASFYPLRPDGPSASQAHRPEADTVARYFTERLTFRESPA